MEKRLEFPEQTFYQTDPWSGKVTNVIKTRLCFKGNQRWSEADIVYYEKMLALEERVLAHNKEVDEALQDKHTAAAMLEQVETDEMLAEGEKIS